MHLNEEKSEKLMVEGSYVPNKRECAANAAQRQQKSERRAGHIEENDFEFH